VQTLKSFSQTKTIDNPAFKDQLNSLQISCPPRSIKIGMLGNRSQGEDLLQCLNSLENPPKHTVFDPILATSSGAVTCKGELWTFIKHDLLPRTTLLTPNRDEAAALVGFPLDSTAATLRAAEELLKLGTQSVFIKGGHGYLPGTSRHSIWSFYQDYKTRFWLSSARLPYPCRGTGCALSTLIAAELCGGSSSEDAVVSGQWLLEQAYSRAYQVTSPEYRADPSEKSGAASPPKLLPLPMEHSSSHPTTAKPWPKVPRLFTKIGDKQHIDKNLREFPRLAPGDLGFYPIAPSLKWLYQLASWGVKTIQLRIKTPLDLEALMDQSDGEPSERLSPAVTLEKMIEVACAFAAARKLNLYINDHWRLAIKYQAYGVHLGQEDLDDADLDSIHTAKLKLGISTHSESELARAVACYPSYVALGPIFPTSCKSMAFGPHGLSKISRWSAMTDVPVVAIGGMEVEHVGEAQSRGAAGVAVISGWLKSQDPEKACQTWLEAFDSSV
jgi:hydroxymethylpyrimidine kinase/phosphomethylpyrimidine kinase/thiamine-phosphate diphosphorylase